MSLIDLSLTWRLTLAFLSGSSVWLPIIFEDLASGVYWRFEVGFMPAGFFLGALVLAPCVSSHAYPLIRAVALVIAAVLIQALAVHVTINESYLYAFGVPGDYEVILNVMFATVLLCVATGWIAPIRITGTLIGYSLVAGLIAGLSFWVLLTYFWTWLCFSECPWWNDLAFVGGWVIWHMAICVALYFSRSPRQTGQ